MLCLPYWLSLPTCKSGLLPQSHVISTKHAFGVAPSSAQHTNTSYFIIWNNFVGCFNWMSIPERILCTSLQQNMAGPVPQMKVVDKASSTQLSLPQQYARVRFSVPFPCECDLVAIFSVSRLQLKRASAVLAPSSTRYVYGFNTTPSLMPWGWNAQNTGKSTITVHQQQLTNGTQLYAGVGDVQLQLGPTSGMDGREEQCRSVWLAAKRVAGCVLLCSVAVTESSRGSSRCSFSW